MGEFTMIQQSPWLVFAEKFYQQTFCMGQVLWAGGPSNCQAKESSSTTTRWGKQWLNSHACKLEGFRIMAVVNFLFVLETSFSPKMALWEAKAGGCALLLSIFQALLHWHFLTHTTGCFKTNGTLHSHNYLNSLMLKHTHAFSHTSFAAVASIGLDSHQIVTTCTPDRHLSITPVHWVSASILAFPSSSHIPDEAGGGSLLGMALILLTLHQGHFKLGFVGRFSGGRLGRFQAGLAQHYSWHQDFSPLVLLASRSLLAGYCLPGRSEKIRVPRGWPSQRSNSRASEASPAQHTHHHGFTTILLLGIRVCIHAE